MDNVLETILAFGAKHVFSACLFCSQGLRGLGNDTHNHGPLSAMHRKKEMVRMVAKAEKNPRSISSLSKKEFMEVYLASWIEPELHRKAARFGIENMLTGEFNGTSDRFANPQLLELWKSWGMDALRANAVADVDAEFYVGNLPWECETQEKLLRPFPRRGKLDTYKACQDDEGEDPGVDLPHDEDEFGKDFFVDPDAIELQTELASAANSSAHLELEACSALVDECAPDPVATAAQEERMTELGHLDNMLNEATGLKCRKTLGHISRKRANVLKNIRRAEETGGTIDTIQHRLLLEDRARRKADADKRIEMDAKVAAIKDAHEQLAAERALHEERLREAAAVAAEAQHKRAIANAFIKLQWTQFDASQVGMATSVKNRRDAVLRLLELLGTEADPGHLKNYDFDFPRWDNAMVAQFSVGNAWGNMLYKMIQQQINYLNAGKPELVRAWWQHQTSLVTSAVVLPAV